MHSVTGAYRVVAGRYHLLERIGSGGVGTVWRARDLVAGFDVAVKEVRIPGLASERDRRVLHERSVREARVTARLSHPAIVPVYDVLDAEGRPWIVMELVVAARSLSKVLAEDGPMPPLRAAEMGTKLVGALASAHAAGIVHRDVKPGNVLLSTSGRVLLADFGIATLEGDPHLTQVGMVIGTPGFCSPERIRGEPASPASDLWSLGATLYAAVAGHGPFDREGSLMAILAGIVHGEPMPPPSAGPLAPVIAALMTRDPGNRPDAATAGRLLAAVVAGEDVTPWLPRVQVQELPPAREPPSAWGAAAPLQLPPSVQQPPSVWEPSLAQPPLPVEQPPPPAWQPSAAQPPSPAWEPPSVQQPPPAWGSAATQPPPVWEPSPAQPVAPGWEPSVAREPVSAWQPAPAWQPGPAPPAPRHVASHRRPEYPLEPPWPHALSAQRPATSWQEPPPMRDPAAAQPPPAPPTASLTPRPAPPAPPPHSPAPVQPYVTQPFLGRHSRRTPPSAAKQQPPRQAGIIPRVSWAFRPGRHRRADTTRT